MHAASYQELLATCKEFQDLVSAHKGTADYPNVNNVVYNDGRRQIISETDVIHDRGKAGFDQLIGKEEREIGDTGLKPYLMYLHQNKGYIYATLVAITNIFFTSGQVTQNLWLAANVQNSNVSTLNLVLVYTAIGSGSIIFLLFRSLLAVNLNIQSSRSLFSQLLSALFSAPMSFFYATPLGRILSRVSAQNFVKIIFHMF
jgi:ABC-type multidrug transport system fused ATPase/permease subunit